MLKIPGNLKQSENYNPAYDMGPYHFTTYIDTYLYITSHSKNRLKKWYIKSMRNNSTIKVFFS